MSQGSQRDRSFSVFITSAVALVLTLMPQSGAYVRRPGSRFFARSTPSA